MFQIGDTVLYGADGICTVTEIAMRTFGKEEAEYLVLTPLHQSRSVIYVPTASQVLLDKMHRVLSADEVRQIVREVAREDCAAWMQDENVRRDHYKEVLQSGDRRACIRLIKTIWVHGKEQKERGRKLHHVDEMAMKEAERLLYEEFAYVLGIKPEDVLPFIIKETEQ